MDICDEITSSLEGDDILRLWTDRMMLKVKNEDILVYLVPTYLIANSGNTAILSMRQQS